MGGGHGGVSGGGSGGSGGGVSPVGGAVMGGPRRTDKRGRFMWTSTLSQGAAGGSQGSMAMKFRPPKETPREETKGKLPCAEATSVQQVR